MRIKKLRIENFKKFQELEVEFQELDCLIGGNNKGFEEYSKLFKKGWDSLTSLKKAKEFLQKDWKEPLHLVDAKQAISTLVGWLQANGYESFSNKKILEAVQKEDLPEEIHVVVNDLAQFVGLKMN